MRSIILIAHNIRSTHNVGSLLRTAEGLGTDKVYLTGYTPFPLHKAEQRLPHVAAKINRQISKTALGAEKFIDWQQSEDIMGIIKELKQSGYEICAVEQAERAIPIQKYQPAKKVALILGNEVSGIDPEILSACTALIEIPMFGKKESFNVVQAAAMAMFHCRFS